MKLTAQEIIQIHEDLIKLQSISPGYKNKDDIYTLIDKLDTDIFGTKLYKDKFTKGAALFEGIIRLHPFIDGNKRTALASLQQYLLNEDLVLVIPLSAVRMCIKVAKNHDNSEDGVNQLINSLVKWIKYRSTKKYQLRKIKEILESDVKLLLTVRKIAKRRKDSSLKNKFLEYCIGADIYPDNKVNYEEILKFLKNRYEIVLKYLKN